MKTLIGYNNINISRLMKYISGKKLSKIFDMITTHLYGIDGLDKNGHFRMIFFFLTLLHNNDIDCKQFCSYISLNIAVPDIWLYNLDNIHIIIDLAIQPIGDMVRHHGKKLIGHRGCGYYNNNTKKSVICGIHRGCNIIEVDIQRYMGSFICSHDNIEINEDILDSDGNDLFDIYRLAKILDNTDIEVMFDCKFNEEFIMEFYTAISSLFKYYTIASFYERHLLVNGPSKVLISCSIPLDDFASIPNKLDTNIVSLYYNNITPDLVNTLHMNNMVIYVYTVNNPIMCKHLLEMDVDGIITDYP